VTRALNEVAKGGSVLDPKVVEALVAAKDRMAHSPLGELTERAVEKHINSMFHKLGLTEETEVHRRVMAVLAFLRETEHA